MTVHWSSGWQCIVGEVVELVTEGGERWVQAIVEELSNQKVKRGGGVEGVVVVDGP